MRVLSTAAILAAMLGLATAAPAATATRHAKPIRYPFAGYITAPGTATSSAATIVIPAYTCTKKLSAIVAAAIVYDSAGNLFSGAEVEMGCSRNGTVFLSALVNVDNQFSSPSVTLAVGDSVALSVTCGPSGISASVDDTTTSSTGTGSSANPETCTQAEIGDDAVANKKGSALVPVPAFGSITYASAMVNGAALGSLNPTQASLFEGSKNVITAGPLTSGGTTFVTTRG